MRQQRGCPDRLWVPHPWKCLSSVYTGLQAGDVSAHGKAVC